MREIAKAEQQNYKNIPPLPDDEKVLDAVFTMLRVDDAFFGQLVGNVISTASFMAALAGLVLAFGVASLAFPTPRTSMLGAFKAAGIPGLYSVSKVDQGPLVVALVTEFALLLVSTGYFTLYPVVRALLAQRTYTLSGVKYLIADPNEKQQILKEALTARTSAIAIISLVGTVVLPFLLLILGAITSLYAVLLHIPG